MQENRDASPEDPSTSEEEILRLWQEEAQRRLRDLRDGKAREVPAEEVFRRALAMLSEG